MMHNIAITLCLAVAVLLSSDSIASGVSLRELALSGTAAPGVASQIEFIRFGSPVLNNNGAATFWARLRSNSTTLPQDANSGIWKFDGVALALAAGGGVHGQGEPSQSFGHPFITDDNEIVFEGSDTNQFGFDAIWRSNNGVIENVAKELNGPFQYTSMDTRTLSVSSFGHIAVSGSVGTGINNDGTMVAEPGQSGTWRATGPNFQEMVSAANGHIATKSGSSNSLGIFQSNPQDRTFLDAVVRQDERAYGTSGFTTFGSIFSDPSINSHGSIAFASKLTTFGFPTVDSSNDDGIWAYSPNRLVAREEEPIPGYPGELFDVVSNQTPLINDEGFVAFYASSSAFPYMGIWKETANGMELVAKVGDVVNSPTGVATIDSFKQYLFNSAGQIAFEVVLEDESTGIWAENPMGQLEYIVRTGESVQLDSGEERIVDDIHFAGDSGNSDGRRSGFNDLGQLIFAADFSDNTSGVFLSEAASRVSVGDFNYDGTVDGSDFLAWQRVSGTSGGLSSWRTNYGQVTSLVALVPEPTSQTLSIICLVILMWQATKRELSGVLP